MFYLRYGTSLSAQQELQITSRQAKGEKMHDNQRLASLIRRNGKNAGLECHVLLNTTGLKGLECHVLLNTTGLKGCLIVHRKFRIHSKSLEFSYDIRFNEP